MATISAAPERVSPTTFPSYKPAAGLATGAATVLAAGGGWMRKLPATGAAVAGLPVELLPAAGARVMACLARRTQTVFMILIFIKILNQLRLATVTTYLGFRRTDGV